MFSRSLTAQIATILVVTFLLAGVGFSYLYHKQEQAGVQTLLLTQARAMFLQVIEMRHWNARYGGVYVLKKPGMETNKYLYKVGPKKDVKAEIKPEVIDNQGNVYTLKNPALMTRELSEMLQDESDVRFHLTSLKLLNPNNRPDAFEVAALNRFEQGQKEMFTVEEGADGKRFRYMAPLKVEKACLKCHGFQGYEFGDIRGGLSLDLPMKSAMAVASQSRMTTIAGGFSIMALMILILWFSIRQRVVEPVKQLQLFSNTIGEEHEVDGLALSGRRDEIGSLSRVLMAAKSEVRKQQQQLISMANSMDEDRRHDPLTMLHNRRHLYLEGPQLFDMAHRLEQEVSVLMIDLDYFKDINDRFGHAAGDQVLIETAAKLLEHSRSYDLLVRFGGEEFALIILNCNLEQSLQIAERIRNDIEVLQVEYGSESISVTCSIGVCSGSDLNMEQMLLQADEAMYEAKASGRNGVRYIRIEPKKKSDDT